MSYLCLILSGFVCFLALRHEEVYTLTLHSSHVYLSLTITEKNPCSVTKYCADCGSFISQIPLSHTTHFLSYPLIDKTLFALQRHYLPRLSMVLGWRTTALLRIEQNFPLNNWIRQMLLLALCCIEGGKVTGHYEIGKHDTVMLMWK